MHNVLLRFVALVGIGGVTGVAQVLLILSCCYRYCVATTAVAIGVAVGAVAAVLLLLLCYRWC